MTKTDELMFMADRYAGIGLGFGDPGPQRDALRTAIEQTLTDATLVEQERCAMIAAEMDHSPDGAIAAAIRKGEAP